MTRLGWLAGRMFKHRVLAYLLARSGLLLLIVIVLERTGRLRYE